MMSFFGILYSFSDSEVLCLNWRAASPVVRLEDWEVSSLLVNAEAARAGFELVLPYCKTAVVFSWSELVVVKVFSWAL